MLWHVHQVRVGVMAVNKYTMLQESLAAIGKGSMTVFGQSMKPILESGSKIDFEVRATYKVGDICFSKVNGRFVDCHLITKVGPDGRFLISNNHGHDNGWASVIYGKAVRATHKGVTKEL